MSVANQVLVFGPGDSGQSVVVKDLFGREADVTVHRAIPIETKYYKTKIDLWMDEYENGQLQLWAQEFMSEEAKPMRESLSGLVFTFNYTDKKDEVEDFLTHLGKISESLDELAGEDDYNGWSGFRAAVVHGIPSSKTPLGELELKFQEVGFELLDYTASGKNEYGEHTGVRRLREIFETCEWSTDDDDSNDNTNSNAKFEETEALDKAFRMAVEARAKLADITDQQEREKLANEKITEIMSIL